MIQQHTGASPGQVSLLELMNFDANNTANDSETLFINGGYQKLPEMMAKKAIATGNVKILRNTPVKAIHYSPQDNLIRVIAANTQEYTASCVVCAVPLGVLQNQCIDFVPKLSEEKQALIKHLTIGFHNKIILEFKKVFWPKDSQFLFPSNSDYHYFPEYLNLFRFSNERIPGLVGHFCASNARFKNYTDDYLVEKALSPLIETYGKTAIALKDAFVTHWDTDPYTLGSTSCCGIHSKAAELRYFAEPEQGGLFFAGAHTLTSKNRETVKGAYVSGVRTALDVNQYLKKKRYYSPA